jgi:hypothetical protein
MKTVLAYNGMKPCNPCTAGFCSYYAYDAARVSGKTEPLIADVLEMLKWLAGMESKYLTPVWGKIKL